MHEVCLLAHVTDNKTVDADSVIIVILAMYDSIVTLLLYMPLFILYIIEVPPYFCILDRHFLSTYSLLAIRLGELLYFVRFVAWMATATSAIPYTCAQHHKSIVAPACYMKKATLLRC